MTNSSKSLKSIIAYIVGATIAVGALSACNTVAGAGKDIKSGGKVIEKTAEGAK